MQKGLVLLKDGVELIEEGSGFGVPLAKYNNRTFFSLSAHVFLHEYVRDRAVLSKVFILDAISRKQILDGPYINDRVYSFLHRTFEKPYLNREFIGPFFDSAMKIRKSVGVNTQFVKVKPKGAVTITYHCLPAAIQVHVNFSALDRTDCQEILLLNEQGAGFFRKYTDSDGTVLFDRKIGAWKEVTSKKASFSSPDKQVKFSLKNVSQAKLYRGREQISDRFAWAGLTYALYPNVATFDYEIELG